MLFRRLWRCALIVMLMFQGIIQLYWVGARKQPFHPRVRAIMQRWYARMLRILNVDVDVIGTIPHEKDGAVILIANHISWVDIPLIGGQTPVNFLSKAEVLQWPLVGSIAQTVGTLFIHRGSGDTEHVMHVMHERLSHNLSVLFFPEGTTTDGTKVRRFHKKLFKVCHDTDVQVVPLLIHYSVDEGQNTVPFVGDVAFGTHFWQMLALKKIHATIEVMPSVKLVEATVGHQIRAIELAMREKLADRATIN
ncbi:MAG TPA: lysophospholipid acyltransferase family protein [Dongiaceae bacterium]|nr:lysophospholipid acyltransferase family protein [Dongiaceae bacterium]